MSDHYTDDQLRALARGYNAPPPVPRDEMWERIRAARTTERAPAPPAGQAFDRGRRIAPWLAAGLGLAAALLLGVVIGRRMESATRPASVLAAAGTRTPHAVGRTPIAAPAVPDDSTASGASSALPAARLASATNARAGAGSASARTAEQAEAVRRELEQRERRQLTRPRELRAPASTPYEIITTRHLAQAEALLTAFRAEAASGQVDPHVTEWASDLLSTTRLLMDSPAAQDPRTGRLLGDLELVLAQIADLPSTRDALDLMLIDQAVERRNVMSRLRAALPAGA